MQAKKADLGDGGLGKAARTLVRLRNLVNARPSDIYGPLGMTKQAYRYYETEYRRAFLPDELLEQIAPLFRRLGAPDTALVDLFPPSKQTPEAVSVARNARFQADVLAMLREIRDLLKAGR